MKLLMQEFEELPDNNLGQNLIWDIGFFGRALDERGNTATTFVTERCSKVMTIHYDAENMGLEIDGEVIDVDDLESAFEFIKEKNLIIEATTLSFPEILLLLKHIKEHALGITIIYLEPNSYSRKRFEPVIDRREYELSKEYLGYIPIPGFSGSFSEEIKNTAIFISGFESERIYRGIEDNQINPRNCILVFGVPAFQAGWEMSSFANNIRVIKEQNISGGIHFAGANNPGSVLKLLNEIHGSLQEDEELNIVPVGPKPASIAAALFAVDREKVNVLFDHPIKKEQRTKEVKKWHLFEVKF